MTRGASLPGSIWRDPATGKWKLDFPLGYDTQGNRKRTRRTADTQGEVRRIQKDLYLQSEKSAYIPPRHESLREYGGWWIQNVKRGRVRESTLGDYQYRLEHWVLPYLGSRRVSGLTDRDVEEWMRMLRRRGNSVKTVNGARTILNQVLNHAQKAGHIPTNPAALASPLREQHGDITSVQDPWSVNEVNAAIAAVKGSDLELFAALCAIYGFRRGEALGLYWDDFDFGAGTVTINRGLKQARIVAEDNSVSTKNVEDATKTRASQRTLKLTPYVQSMVVAHRERQEQARRDAGPRWVESGRVFTSRTGTAVSPSNVSRQFRKLLVAGGVRLIRIHDMRHTAAVRALDNGVTLAAVSQALGHTDVNMTKSIYAPNVPSYNDDFVNVGSSLYHSLEHELDQLVRDRHDGDRSSIQPPKGGG